MFKSVDVISSNEAFVEYAYLLSAPLAHLFVQEKSDTQSLSLMHCYNRFRKNQARV